jgi:integrase-like protein
MIFGGFTLEPGRPSRFVGNVRPVSRIETSTPSDGAANVTKNDRIAAAMSIQARRSDGRTRWLVRWEVEGRHRGRTFDRKADAEAFEREVRRRSQLGAHTPAEPSREPLADWLRRWFTRDSPAWAASTRQHRGYVIGKWISPFLGGVRLSDLGSARVRQWRADIRAAGCSAHQAVNGQVEVPAGGHRKSPPSG